MRNLLLIAAISMLTFVGANAQNAQGWNLGIKGGANFAADAITPVTGSIDTKTMTSFYVAGVAEYFCNEKWSLQGELMYSQNGAKKVTASSTSTGYPFVNGDLVSREMSMPMLLKRHFGKFSIGAGFNFGYTTATKFTYSKADGAASDITVSGPRSDDMDFGLLGNVEFNITKHLFIDARYVYGLTNIAAGTPGTSYKSRVAQAGIGFRF